MKENIIDKDLKKEKIESTNDEKTEENDETKFKKLDKKAKKIDKEIDEMSPQEKKKKWFIIVIVCILVLIGIFVSTIFALVNINNDKIISGVSISGIDVSGLSKNEAKAELELIYTEKLEREIDIKYQDYESTLNPTLMEVKYDIDKAVSDAYLVGKSDNIILNNYNILFALIGKKNINVDMSLNEEVAKQTIQDIGMNLPGIVIDSTYAIEESNLIISKGKAGVSIDINALLEKVKDNLNDINAQDKVIEIPVVNKKPEEIDINKIHEAVYKEVKDAYYTKNPFTIYPEVEGVDFDIEVAKTILAEDKEEYVIPLTITKPKVTIEQIGSEAFPDRLSYFTTRFDESDVDRSTNLRIACQKLDGKVVLSGETLSYNNTLGPRTVANGYKNGKIYSGGQVVDGIGGGICQISSTLYNAVLMANLEIVERRNHQFVTSYVEAGRDATVVYGLTDFKFKNTRKYPVKISATAKNGIATIAIYGIKEQEEYTFTFYKKVVATIPYTTKYVEDSSLAVGQEKVIQKGSNGIKTETYMTKLLNGKVISTVLLSRDTYDAMTKVVHRGKGTTTNNKTTTTKPSETTTPSTQSTTSGSQTQKPTQNETNGATSSSSNGSTGTTNSGGNNGLNNKPTQSGTGTSSSNGKTESGTNNNKTTSGSTTTPNKQ